MRGSLSTRRERWARLGRHLWQPPRPHGEQPDERVVGPLELFYDLVVVVLVAQARTRAHGAAFAIAASVLFAVLAVLWLLAARGDRPEYRLPSRLFVAGTAATAAAPAGSALLPAGARVPAWGLLEVGYLTGYTLIIPRTSQVAARMVTGALTERFGAFTIIVLGETLTGVVAGLSGRPVSGITLSVALAGVGRQRAVDARPPAAHGGHRRDGRGDADRGEPAGLAHQPRRVPAARPHLRRRGGGLPRRRRRAAGAARPGPRARYPARRPLGVRGHPPAGPPGQ